MIGVSYPDLGCLRDLKNTEPAARGGGFQWRPWIVSLMQVVDQVTLLAEILNDRTVSVASLGPVKTNASRLKGIPRLSAAGFQQVKNADLSLSLFVT